jgi:hypothetical protein
MSDTDRFLAAHPELREAMQASAAFEDIKQKAILDIDGETLYIIRGDTLGTAEDLYLETIVRGAQQENLTDPRRAVYLELDPKLRALIDQRVDRAARREPWLANGERREERDG